MSTKETFIEALEKWTKVHPNKLAWQFYNDKLEIEDTYTFQELENATTALSSYLLDDCGLKTGDVVLLVFVPGLAFTASLIACFKAGLVGVPVYPPNPTQLGKELHHFTTIQQDCGAKVALTHGTYSFAKTICDVKGFFSFGKKEVSWPDLRWIQVDSVLNAGKIVDAAPRYNPQADLSFLQYTSGSTSAPKGVMVSPENLTAQIHYMSSSCGFTHDTVTVSWLPQYHDMGLIGTYLKSVFIGGTGHYMSPMGFLKDPLTWIRLTARAKATYTVAPNFAFGLVLRKVKEAKQQVRDEVAGLDLSNLATLVSAAEPVDPKILQEFLAKFEPNGLSHRVVSVCYGLAENTLSATSWGRGLLMVDKAALEEKQAVVVEERVWHEPFSIPDGAVALVSCGGSRTASGPLAIVDPETLLECEDGKVGEIWLAGDSKAQGYYNRPDATHETFSARLKGSNLTYMRSGDSAFVYKNEVYFCGRIKDIIIINGLNYYPQDMERTVESCHDAIRAGCSAAFALKQESDLSECAVLVAELKAGVPASKYEEIVEKIISAVSQEQGLYLVGVCLLKTKSIPKTTSGKISRASCRKAFLEKKLSIVHQWDDLEPAVPVPSFNSSSSGSRHAAAPAAAGNSSSAPATVQSYSLAQVKQKIVNMVQEVGGLTNVRTDAILLDIGLTSSATTELSGRISKEFGVKIRPTVMFTSPTIDDVSLRVVELIAANNVHSSAANTQVAAEEVQEDEEDEDAPFVRPEAFIAGWGIAVPFPLSSERFLEIDAEERRKLGQPQEVIDQMATLVKSSRIKNRHTCHPAFLPKDKKPSDYPNAVGTMKENIYKNGSNPEHYERIRCYQDTVVQLCVAAAEKAVKHWGKDKMAITHILTTCTSGWSEPGIGCAVVKGLGLSQDIQKAELNFNGCFCGATCLRMARDIIRAGDATAVLIVACEVASSHYDWTQLDTERMIAQSLFADGAASMVVAREGVWKYSQTGSSILPNSGHLLGLRPPLVEEEHIYCMTLSKLVSPSLYAYFSKGHGKDILKKLYNPREQKPALAIHPGGPRILEAVGDVFFELGWKEDALQASFDTFGNFGNLGSAAMLFVLANRLSQNDIVEDKLITMAFGPGVTVEYAQLEHHSLHQKKQQQKNARKAAVTSGAAAQPVVVARNNGSNQSAVQLLLALNSLIMLVFGAYFFYSTRVAVAGVNSEL